MVGIRYPRPLVAGDLVGVATPSSGVPASLHDRLDAALDAVAAHGFRTRVGELARVDGVTSGPPEARAAELTEMMTDPSVRAVIPPWGGDLAVDLLDRLDVDALAVDPTWLIGYSDLSTLMTPLTLATGIATLHGANLMDTPYELPVEFSSWVDVVTAPAGATLVQSAAPRRRIRPWGPWATEPRTRDDAYEEPTRWRRLDGDDPVTVTGRLIGGCLETIALLPGTPYGDLDGFARRHAPEGLLVYLEAAEADTLETARLLHRLRLAGWFDHANAVLIGRTPAPESPGYPRLQALTDTLGGLGIPVLYDADVGHEPPQLPLVNGALAEVEWDAASARITQRLVP